MFVDTGVPRLFEAAYEAGAAKERLVVKVAGGGNVNGGKRPDRFAIGKRNLVMLRRLLWHNGVLIESEDTGGDMPRTLYLEVGSGLTWVTTAGKRTEL